MDNPQAIRALRERLGMTQAQFGVVFGVGRNAVTYWEKGGRRPTAAKRFALDCLERAKR